MTDMGGDNCVLLVRRTLQPGHPHAIWSQLFAECRKLLREGISTEILQDALREWENRPNMGPAMMPHLVSEVVRKRRHNITDVAKREFLASWEQRLEAELGE